MLNPKVLASYHIDSSYIVFEQRPIDLWFESVQPHLSKIMHITVMKTRYTMLHPTRRIDNAFPTLTF